MTSSATSASSTSRSPLLETKLAKLLELQRLTAELQQIRGAGEREYFPGARTKQLPPDHPSHHLPDTKGFTCGCQGNDTDWMIWVVMAGRGWGKSAVGSNWVVHQAMTHPGSEWAVFAPTFRDTRKTCIEGSSGILAALGDGELDQYRRNELQIVLANGSVIYGYSADQPERARGANLWGAWCDEMGCLPGGVLVRAERGEVPIQDVQAGERVWTRSGLRRVLWAGPTRRNAELWELTTGTGERVVCTPDHQVWTGNGWKEASRVTPGDIMFAWQYSNSRPALPLGSPGTGSAGTESTSPTRRAAATTATLAETSSTGSSGNASTARYLRATTSTTATTTKPTTTSTTSNSSLPKNTCGGIPRSGSTRTGSTTAPVMQPVSEPTNSGAPGSRALSPADGAAPSSTRQGCAPSSAAGHAGRATVVVASRPLPYREPITYDLTVEGEPEFYANGLLVHNSWRYEQTWHEGLVPALRKGQNPRVVVTTTPRPTPLVRMLVGRGDGSVHLTRGPTWENAANLSTAALEELRRRYEGTRLGRQELEGELLDDIEGALWSRGDIDAARVAPEQVPDLVRVVVAVDPAVTSGEESDETGIVVVGESGDGQGYVLADYSMKGSPDACMRRAVRAFREHEADSVVAEVNNGGDYLGAVLRAVDPDVPYRTVRASRGKAVRAEPVAALYEQRRVHHVGSFPQLEDQMATWTPDALESPDRVDALVWGLSELRGLSSGSWSDAFGVARCDGCSRTFMASLHPDRCPYCRRPREVGV